MRKASGGGTQNIVCVGPREIEGGRGIKKNEDGRKRNA